MSADAKVAEIRRDPPAVTSVIRHTVKAGPESRRGIRMAHDESRSNTLDRIPGSSSEHAPDVSPGLPDQTISLAPDEIWLYTNRAHALMFLGRVDEARELYLRNCGEVNVVGERSYEKVLLEDFAELRKAGLTHPLMDAIEKQLAKRG